MLLSLISLPFRTNRQIKRSVLNSVGKRKCLFYTSPKVLKPASVLESVRELLNTDYQGFQPEISNFNWSGMDPGIYIFTGASDREDC